MPNPIYNQEFRDNRKKEIIKTAYIIVEEGGYDALNIREIAKRTGFKTPIITRLLTKSEITVGVIELLYIKNNGNVRFIDLRDFFIKK